MKAQKQNKNAFTHKEEHTMAKTLIAFFSRADENYFGGAMRYVKTGNYKNRNEGAICTEF